MDIVRKFESICDLNGVSFHYGSESHLNLLDGDFDDDKVYLLLFPVRRDTTQIVSSISIQGISYTGRFLLLVGSDYSNHYFNENNADSSTSKYTVNIEPLLDFCYAIPNIFMCDDYEVTRYSCEEAINILDCNKDGLWINFNFIKRGKWNT